MASVQEIDTVDVLIAGAGPAGSSAAAHLAGSGLDVMMLERKMEIGAPVTCADQVNLSLGGLERFRNDKRLCCREIDNLEVAGPSGNSSFKMLSASDAGDAFNTVVERDRLDKELASQALINGARLRMRSELTGFEEDGGGITATYIAEGKPRTVRAGILLIATGSGCNSVSHAEKMSMLDVSYRYSRSINHGKPFSRLQLLNGGRSSYRVWRTSNEYNTLLINPHADTLKSPEPGESRSIITGSLSISYPAEFNAGTKRVLNLGQCSGLYDPFFHSGFREAYISGRLSAISVLEAGGDVGNASAIYKDKIIHELIPGISASARLAGLMYRTADENIESFVGYLSGLEFREISTLEILRVASLKDSELEEFFPPVH